MRNPDGSFLVSSEDEPAQREAAALKAWSSELTEGEKWAKFPTTAEDEYIFRLIENGYPASAHMIGHILTELIKQRAEISTLKAALNIED